MAGNSWQGLTGALLVAGSALASAGGGAVTTTADDQVEQLLSRPGRSVSMLVESTLGWGCPCPTWAWTFHRQLSRPRQPMLLPAPSLRLDPTGLALPGLRVRVWGHFTGQELDGETWAVRRGAVPPGYPAGSDRSMALAEYWRQPGPVFVVDRWCFLGPVQAAERRRLLDAGAIACR